MFRSFAFLVLCFVPFLFVSCDDDGPEDPGAGEEELITSVVVRLSTDTGATIMVPTHEFRFVDVDGPGGDDPVIVGDTLSANTTYYFQTNFGNSTTSQLNDEVTEEVREEGDEHQVFYSLAGVSATIRYADTDANGRPIGLEGFLETGASGSGTFMVTLRHEPTKDAAGVESGDITNAGGSTDVEVVFPVQVL